MTDEARTKASFVTPPMSPQRRERMLARLEARQPGRPRSVGRWLVAAAALVAAGGVGYAVGAGVEAPTPEVALEPVVDRWIETGDALETLAPAPGVELVLAPHTQLRLSTDAPGALGVYLERGSVACEAASDARVVRVRASAASIRIVGARARVLSRGAAGPRVEALSGTVRVSVGNETPIVLPAGQSWEWRPGPRELAPSPDEVAPAPAPRPAPSPPSAADLIRRAQSHRLAGRVRRAASAYHELRVRYPEDPRAGLAAFEEGRIRLYDLSDPRGALRALDAARDHSMSFLDADVAAARIAALDELGERTACATERRAFLERFADSAHATDVQGACTR